MNSKHDLTQEVVSYIEPEKWQPNGIKHHICSTGISVNDGAENEIVEVNLCPEFYNCQQKTIETFILPKNKDAIDCLLCYSVDDNPYKDSYLKFNKKMLDLHNQARAEFCLDCNVLKLDEQLIHIAQWFANDMATHDYYLPHHKDRFGRSPAGRYQVFGLDYIEAGENLNLVVASNFTDEQFIQECFSSWMNSPHHRANILHPDYKEVGFAFACKDTVYKGIKVKKCWFVAEFGLLNRKRPVIPDPEKPCTSECMKPIKWYQRSETIEKWDYSSGKPQLVNQMTPESKLVFEVPYIDMCGIERMKLWGEVSGTLADIFFSGKGTIKDNQLEFLWDPYKSWPLVISFDETRPFPGELILLLVYMRGFDSPCNPWIAGYTWFETFCFTSGKILSCCRVDKDEKILEEVDEIPDNWSLTGDDIRYRVFLKGKKFLLKCSDYARYKAFDRCLIFKKGSFNKLTKDQKVEKIKGCRAGQFEPVSQSELLSDSVISYSLDPKKDVVVPVRFWSEGA